MKIFTSALLTAGALAFDAYSFMPETYAQSENQLLVPSNDSSCWKLAYGRGVGRPIHTCADGLE